jgi:hypothetical protein
MINEGTLLFAARGGGGGGGGAFDLCAEPDPSVNKFWNALYPSTPLYRFGGSARFVVVASAITGFFINLSNVPSESTSASLESSCSSSAGRVGGYIDGVDGAGDGP